jgi:hypothetical protein
MHNLWSLSVINIYLHGHAMIFFSINGTPKEVVV